MRSNLNKVFIDELSSIYSSEQQIEESLPYLIQEVSSPHLKEGLEKHLIETHEQVARLNKIFKFLHLTSSKRSCECEAIKGLIEDCKKAINEYPKGELRDAALIAKAQCIEHYEIAVYGTLIAFAKELDLENDVVNLLKDSLGEEGKADKKLTKVAEGGIFTSGINKAAR